MNKLIPNILIAAVAASTGINFVCGSSVCAASSKGKAEDEKIEQKAPQISTDPETKLKLKEMVSPEALNQWMTFYYLHPQPELLVAALLLADKLGFLTGDASAPLQAFTSRVFAANPDKVKGWYQDLLPVSENGKTMILTALWWSNTPEAKEVLQGVAAQLPEKPQAAFKKQIDTVPANLDTMEAESPAVLDMLWACFCATGDEKYVKRLVTILATAKEDSKDLAKMMILSTGRWSLLSNIEQHKKVKEYCESLKGDPTLGAYVEKALADAKPKTDTTANTAAPVAGDGDSAAASDKKKNSKSSRSKDKKASVEKNPPVDLQMKVDATAATPAADLQNK